MKLAAILTACLVSLAATPADAHESGLTIDILLSGATYKTCDVHVPAGADGGQALDAAVASGCLLEWSHDSFEGFGRYVTSVDYLGGAVATYWALYVDGAYSDLGIDDLSLQPGQTLSLNYEQWVVA